MGIAEVTAILETLSQEDFDMVVMLIDRLAEKTIRDLERAFRLLSDVLDKDELVTSLWELE